MSLATIVRGLLLLRPKWCSSEGLHGGLLHAMRMLSPSCEAYCLLQRRGDVAHDLSPQMGLQALDEQSRHHLLWYIVYQHLRLAECKDVVVHSSSSLLDGQKSRHVALRHILRQECITHSLRKRIKRDASKVVPCCFALKPERGMSSQICGRYDGLSFLGDSCGLKV